jgi:hypothetical protein
VAPSTAQAGRRCDLTTAPDGSAVSASARLSDVVTRYGDDHPVGRAVRRSREELLALVSRVATVEGETRYR